MKQGDIVEFTDNPWHSVSKWEVVSVGEKTVSISKRFKNGRLAKHPITIPAHRVKIVNT
jgi:hypothetical protein